MQAQGLPEKDWIVECWGDLGETDVFYTEKETRGYFKNIRKKLDSSKYIFTKNSIVEINNPDNAVYLTNARDL